MFCVGSVQIQIEIENVGALPIYGRYTTIKSNVSSVGHRQRES